MDTCQITFCITVHISQEYFAVAYYRFNLNKIVQAKYMHESDHSPHQTKFEIEH